MGVRAEPRRLEARADLLDRAVHELPVDALRAGDFGRVPVGEADGDLLEKVAAPDAAGRQLLTQAAERLKLSARGYHRVLRVARTLADMDGAEAVKRVHIAEALSYRRIALAGA